MNKAIESAIYEAALSLDDVNVRHEFLEGVFQGNPDGLKRMKKLLDTAGDVTSYFLEAREARSDLAMELVGTMPDHMPRSDSVDPLLAARAGLTIGNYQLVRCLGQGGSGIVYEAEQTYPVKRRVALKIFWIDAGSDSAKTRFDIERQALAIMDHPNIAKVLDAGGFHNGSPYFVMELVEGKDITDYCDQEKLDIKQRIKLFIDVCEAIQHAHSKRIIHRDIKPSNVLVSGPPDKPVAKVIDFGIAKAVAASFEVKTTITGHDQFVGTPAYMSPEQVEMMGIDVDTRSDIYSLGVLLYELLTSQTPFDRHALVQSGMVAMRKVILEKPPLKPSARLFEVAESDTKIIAEKRRTTFSRLLSDIKGDLNWITMKSLEKDRNNRYETAHALALDLQRHLENKPVTARRQSGFYTFKKFVSRNKIPFYAAVAVAASIMLGFGTSTVLYFREKEALDEQERLSLEAERARDQELQLRRQAQARANVAQIAFLFGEGKVQEADDLLQQNPLKSIEPSKEAASTFRTLGNWYATYSRWSESVQCFDLMNQATIMSSSDDILRSTDLLTTSAALLELNDKKGYEQFREGIFKRHLPVSDPLHAEHMLKSCLVTKASPRQLDKLKEAAALCKGSVENSSGPFPAWRAYALTLYYYRQGQFQEVIRLGTRSTDAKEIKVVCLASLRALMAAAHHKLGNLDAANIELTLAKALMKEKPQRNDLIEETAIFPKWYDWSVASFLLKEAEAEIMKSR